MKMSLKAFLASFMVGVVLPVCAQSTPDEIVKDENGKIIVSLSWEPIKTTYNVSPENDVFVLVVTPEEALEYVKVESSAPKAVHPKIDPDYGGYVDVRCRAKATGVTVTATIPADNATYTATPATTTPFDVK